MDYANLLGRPNNSNLLILQQMLFIKKLESDWLKQMTSRKTYKM